MRRRREAVHPAFGAHRRRSERPRGTHRRRRTSGPWPPGAPASTPAQSKRSALLFRPPCRDLTDNPAAEREHAYDENDAGDHRHPLAEAGKVVLEADDYERTDDRPEDRAHATE